MHSIAVTQFCTLTLSIIHMQLMQINPNTLYNLVSCHQNVEEYRRKIKVRVSSIPPKVSPPGRFRCPPCVFFAKCEISKTRGFSVHRSNPLT